MFGNSLLRDFDEDPFFSSARDPFQAHNERVRHMMRSFSEPFGGHFGQSHAMPSLRGRDQGRDQGRGAPLGPPGSSSMIHAQPRHEHRDMASREPFGMFDNMMSMRSRMEDMNRNFDNMPTDSDNSHSFSSSSVTTYSKVGDQAPQVFQASSQTRRAPGGIKETRRALRDSESGLEQMAIGHHIQDRGHVVEKKVNKKTGEREHNQDFDNMDESEAQTFDEEWQREVSKFQPSVPMSRLEAPKPPRAVHRAAITGPEQAHREQPRPTAEGRTPTHVNDLNGNASGVFTKH